ncbi:MAG: (2Fe-2S)-binding protein [Parvularculaceae bacterium]
MAVTLRINGDERTIDAADDTPLLWVLRDRLGLTGSKFGCGVAQCGACTVHVNGQPRRACVTPIGSLEDVEVETIEGIYGAEADAVRAAWTEIDAPQCGYCQSGQIMSAIALLRVVPDPDDDDIDGAMAGNLCRCATYMRIRRAIKSAAQNLKT